MTKPQQGFTLIEIILVMSLIMFVSIITGPLLVDSFKRNNLDIALNTAVVASRRANLLARASEGDRSWGVHFENSKVIIFKCPSTGGCNYLGRNVAETDFDEQFGISSAISIGGTTDYVFTKITGETAGGTANFASDNSIKSLSISSNGLVNY